MTEMISPQHLDTAGLAERESRSLTRTMLSSVIGPVEIDAAALAGSRGIQCALPQLAVMTAFFAPAPLRITGSGRANSGRALMVRSMEGPLAVQQGNRMVEADVGDFLFVSGEEPFEWSLPSGGRLDCGSLPLASFRLPPPQLQRILLRPVPKNFPPLQLLITYGAYLLMRGPHGPREAEMANVHFHEILPLVLAYLDADASVPGSDRMQGVKAYIDAHLSDPDLDVSTLAGLNGVTPRSIQKLFQQEGTTFSRYLLERRLAMAQQMIGRSGEDRPISAIAYEVGFGDLSYFNKAFRRQFGQAPSELRKGARR
ncbi:AraC family transcriptional regulator [Metarhizobium album]|uniref:AraC family transcriptional regulator n=1 Tax=Metarhizobium album TaxID=2182425 RepID=A0A2U2DI15_9HYPH|nr:AraC family transcriptional regulator [Rhizobium album]PWE52881.1 AraC family transcriptional regulator [Rhizobium album]